MDLVFVTGNMDKVHWLERFLGKKLEHHKLDLNEIQDIDPTRVLEHKAREAYRILQKPVLVEDTALIFHALGRLPGPLIKFFKQEIDNSGMCRMLNAFDDRSATALITYGYFDGSSFRAFPGEIKGSISGEPKGSFGHGWDAIFIPEGSSRTNGEMDEEEYSAFSARKRAVMKLAEFLGNK